VRHERLVRMRGLAGDEAAAMIRAQLPAPAKRARADYVIDNDADLAELTQRAEQVWAEVLERGG
jgi:dephospho-CoA kinase